MTAPELVRVAAERAKVDHLVRGTQRPPRRPSGPYANPTSLRPLCGRRVLVYLAEDVPSDRPRRLCPNCERMAEALAETVTAVTITGTLANLRSLTAYLRGWGKVMSADTPTKVGSHDSYTVAVRLDHTQRPQRPPHAQGIQPAQEGGGRHG